MMLVKNKVSLTEAFPFRQLRRQAKSKLRFPDATFSGKTVAVIGATGAILHRTTQMIALLQPARIILGVRNLAKGDLMATELRAQADGAVDIEVIHVDFASFQSVKDFSVSLKHHGRIDAYVIGPAVMNPGTVMTSEGWEESLQISHLSCALFIALLLPDILAQHNELPVVISSISSFSIQLISPMVKLPADSNESYLEYVNAPSLFTQRNHQYAFGKIIYLAWLRELCARLPESKVQIHSVDPGSCKSPLAAHMKSSRILLRFIGRPLEMVARAVLNSCRYIDGSHGKLLVDYDVKPCPIWMDRDFGQDLQKRVWKETSHVLRQLGTDIDALGSSE